MLKRLAHLYNMYNSDVYVSPNWRLALNLFIDSLTPNLDTAPDTESYGTVTQPTVETSYSLNIKEPVIELSCI